MMRPRQAAMHNVGRAHPASGWPKQPSGCPRIQFQNMIPMFKFACLVCVNQLFEYIVSLVSCRLSLPGTIIRLPDHALPSRDAQAVTQLRAEATDHRATTQLTAEATDRFASTLTGLCNHRLCHRPRSSSRLRSSLRYIADISATTGLCHRPSLQPQAFAIAATLGLCHRCNHRPLPSLQLQAFAMMTVAAVVAFAIALYAAVAFAAP